MPGHADSSRFRELINFHYIRTMSANLKEVRFLLVITLQLREGKYTLLENEIHMMESFRTMFPTCSKYVTIIVNRIEEARKNEKKVKKDLRDCLADSPYSLKKYFMDLTDSRIYVL